MERAVVAVVLVAMAAVVAMVLGRRRPDAPTQPTWSVPDQLDRADFARPDAPWLVVVFSSTTCLSCADAVEKARVLAAAEVVVQEVEVAARPGLHRRYGIEAVPVTIVADGGVTDVERLLERRDDPAHDALVHRVHEEHEAEHPHRPVRNRLGATGGHLDGIGRGGRGAQRRRLDRLLVLAARLAHRVAAFGGRPAERGALPLDSLASGSLIEGRF